MPTEEEHVSLANVNHAAILHLVESKDGHPEWVAVTAFYKAVQITEAALAHTKKRHSNTHNYRANKLKQLGNRALAKHYRKLWEASCVARYLSHGDNNYSAFSDYLSSDSSKPPIDKVKAFVNKRLRGFESEIVSHLSDGGKNRLNRLEPL